ncbi:hypothetical protein [Luteimonas aquatica]|uniref:hypothetical protein n=1 Tax=Luteimonas aquatica TaxID=450364 RepID=UPI001F57CBD2|nr:hypothetical protein [Luteimonas aquatica]
MNGRGSLSLVLVLALICMAGIVGMLLGDGVLDAACFAMAAVPLLVGLWRWRAARRLAKTKAAANAAS